MFKVGDIYLLKNRHTQVNLILNLPWPFKDVYCTLEFAEKRKEHLVEWHNNGGCGGTVRGNIHLRALGGQTLFTFSMAMKPENSIPQFLINWAFKQHFPKEINRIRLLVERKKNLPAKGQSPSGPDGKLLSAVGPGTVQIPKEDARARR